MSTRADLQRHPGIASDNPPPLSWTPHERVCSLEELATAAEIRPSRKMPITKYFKDLDATLEKAKTRLLNSDLQYAYIFYLRFVTVVLKHLPMHPDYNKPEHARAREKVTADAQRALSRLEKLQPVLKQRYEEYARYLDSVPRVKASVSTYSTRKGSMADAGAGAALIELGDEAGQAEAQGVSLAETFAAINMGGATQQYAQRYRQPAAPREELLIEYPMVPHHAAWQQPHRPPNDSVAPTAPAIPSASAVPPQPFPLARPAAPCPALPPKPPQGYYEEITPTPEPKADGEARTDASAAAKAFMPPCIINPTHHSLTEGGVRMRPIQMPSGIFEEFIDIASANTNKSLETCGVLCGKQVPGQDALIMTTLIIPKQTATSDTCTTQNEEELFVEQMDRDLITLGWIHTHPSQTCFMSSLDLHTHCAYQLMLPEAVAIVCAPRKTPRFGIFRLTDPMGIDAIQACTEKSAFHPHNEEKTIYTDADTGGHIVLANYDFDIIDIRGSEHI